jgi:hypothetical protein
MTIHRAVSAFCLCVLFLAGCKGAREAPSTEAPTSGAIVSGPQVGKAVPGPFEPLNVTGASAGQKACLFCKNGDNPVAMVFARSVSPELTHLIKKIDTCTGKHKDCSMGSFVVFLSDSDSLSEELKGLAKKEKIDRCVLSIDGPAGPAAYKVARDADVTVVLYTDHVVKANYAFKKGEMKDGDVDRIVADVATILPQS